MKLFSKKLKTAMLLSLVIMIICSSLVYASGSDHRTLEAWFNRITIIYNGQNRTQEFDPFIVNGTTYVPLRTMSDIFNKNVEWNANTNTAIVTDGQGGSVAHLENQIIMKDLEILDLQRQIENLVKELDEKHNNTTSVRDLERDLNRSHGRFERLDFEITLRGDDRDIEVRIHTDLRNNQSRWNGLSTRQKTNYLQDIVDDILDAFPDAYIDGYIRDDDSRKDILLFSTTSRGVVRIDEENNKVNLKDLSSDIDNDYYNYFNDINLSIELKGDKDYIDFFIYINYNQYKREWDRLRDTDVRRLMADIYNDIEREYKDAEIVGFVYDRDNRKDLAQYTKDNRGREDFSRY